MRASALSAGMAIVLGILCAVMGLVPIMVAAGAMTLERAPDAPPWVLASAGLACMLAGAAIIVGYGAGGVATPDGNFSSGTPRAIRLTQYLTGLGIAGSIAGIVTWIGFAPGHRRLAGTMLLLDSHGTPIGETVGRAAFRAAAVLAIGMFIGFAVTGAKRLRSH